jgi:hypothetical protein
MANLGLQMGHIKELRRSRLGKCEASEKNSHEISGISKNKNSNHFPPHSSHHVPSFIRKN